jgi:hypothetical protein
MAQKEGIVSQEQLKRQYVKMKMITLVEKEGGLSFPEGESLPFSQGYLIKDIIVRYNIPVKKVGYWGYYVCIETNNQQLFWYDTGVGATFKGIINKVGVEA